MVRVDASLTRSVGHLSANNDPGGLRSWPGNANPWHGVAGHDCGLVPVPNRAPRGSPWGWIDAPTARKNHARPVPLGGGLALGPLSSGLVSCKA